MADSIDKNGSGGVVPRLVGGTFYNILLYYRKSCDENSVAITEARFFAELLNVFGNNIDISDMYNKEAQKFSTQLTSFKKCKKNAFAASYLKREKLAEIKGEEFKAACIRLSSFLKNNIDNKSKIVAALKEVIEEDPSIKDDEGFFQNIDGTRPLTKGRLKKTSAFFFLTFIMSVALYAFKQDNTEGISTIEAWGLDERKYDGAIVSKLGEKYRGSLCDTPCLSDPKPSEEIKLQYEITESDYEALKKQASTQPDLCGLWLKVRSDKNLFVETETFRGVYRTVLKKGCVLVSGNPGTGKTMTSEMIALKMAGMGYVIHYLYGIQEGLEELYEEISKEENVTRKDFIFIDDCMGQASFVLTSSEENQLTRLVSYVMVHKEHKAILLNSRIRIINELGTHKVSNNLYQEMVDGKCVINVDLSRREKAVMLKNHIFARLDEKHYKEVSGQNCLKIVDHIPYIPRVIDHVTNEKNVVKINKNGDFVNAIINAMDNPESVWTEIYDSSESTPLVAKVLLKALYSLTNLECDCNMCRNAFDRYLSLERYISLPNRPWDTAFTLLNESMVKHSNKNGQEIISFLDPSVHDFMDKTVYPKDSPERRRLEDGFMYEAQLLKFGGYEGRELKKAMTKDGRIENIIYESKRDRDEDIFACIAATSCCREAYKSIVNEMFATDAKNRYALSTYELSGRAYSYPRMLVALMKSQKMREFYASTQIPKRIFDICAQDMGIEDAISFFEALRLYPGSLDFKLSEDETKKLIENAVDNSTMDPEEFFDSITLPDNEDDVDRASEELNEAVFTHYEDLIEEHRTALGDSLYVLFGEALENRSDADYEDFIKANCTFDDGYEDDYDYYRDYGPSSHSYEASFAENSDGDIMSIFDEPFHSTKG